MGEPDPWKGNTIDVQPLTNNFSMFINEGIKLLAQDRSEKRQAELRSQEISATVAREKARASAVQESNLYNPLPGNLSSRPSTDLANQSGPMRFDTFISSIPTWSIALIIAVLSMTLFGGFKIAKK